MSNHNYFPVKTKNSFLKAAKTYQKDNKTYELAVEMEEYFKKTYGYVNDSEKKAWKFSVCKAMGKILSSSNIPDDIGVEVEYQIPGFDNRIDMILTGKNKTKEKTVILIIELKQWSCSNGLSEDGNRILIDMGKIGKIPCQFPSEQAYAYKKWLELGIPDNYRKNLEIYSIAYLHNYCEKDDDPIRKGTITDTEIFTKNQIESLIEKISKLLPCGDKGNGIKIITESFTGCSETLQEEIASILNINKLSEEQEKLLKAIENSVEESLSTGQKNVLVVQGDPGTGKSVVALQALANIRCQYGKEESYYLTKTEALRKAYSKKMITDREKRLILAPFLFKDVGSIVRRKNILLSLVDEGQRLESATIRNKTTVSPNNQICDIIEASNVSVFFMDEKQIVSLNDAGNIQKIKQYCNENGYKLIPDFKLSAQFRCNGSNTYLNWLDTMLGISAGESTETAAIGYDIKVMDSFEDFYSDMEALHKSGKHARIVAGYCWPWKSKNDPHNPENADFPKAMKSLTWNWNTWIYKDYVWSEEDYTFPHIGTIHTCLGLEFDYIGVIIGPDLTYENGKLKTDYEKRSKDDQTIQKNGKSINKLITNCEINEQEAKELKELADKIIRNTYRVMLTRGLKGCRIYCTDKNGQPNLPLANYIKNSIKKQYYVNSNKQWYYHAKRDCKYILYKTDQDILAFDNKPQGLIPCVDCCD